MWHGKTDIKSLDYDELKDFLSASAKSRSGQSKVYQWMHEKQADGFEEMTNLKNLQEKLAETCEYTCRRNVQTLVSELDGTKISVPPFGRLCGRGVLMRYQHGNSVCISTQVGCRMGCRFCTSTIGGKTKRSDGGGDARSDLPYPERHQGELSNLGDDGYRRATG